LLSIERAFVNSTLVQWRSGRQGGTSGLFAHALSARLLLLDQSTIVHSRTECPIANNVRDMKAREKKIVLVVDDDASLLRALRRLLLAIDLNVLTFDSAEAFLASRIPAGNVCLLVDIYLPGMSGTGLCKALAALGRSLPTILMTARDDAATQRIAREAGMLSTLYKPFDEDALLNTIARAFGDN
jgi:CheY-like chemotaxis protein